MSIEKKAPAPPREITAEAMRQAGGGKGLVIVCIEHKGQLICQAI